MIYPLFPSIVGLSLRLIVMTYDLFVVPKACSDSLLSSLVGKHPDPKSVHDLALDTRGCITACQGGETNS